MLLNLIFGAAAGASLPIAEPYIRRAVEKLSLAKVPVKDSEFDMVSLIILLIFASLCSIVFGGADSSILLLVGGLVGLFGERILLAVQGRTETETGGKKE